MHILIITYYDDHGLCVDLGFELILQFYLERNLHWINDSHLHIKYGTEVSYCFLLKSTALENEN